MASEQEHSIRLFDSLPCCRCGAPAFFAQAEPDPTRQGMWDLWPWCKNCRPMETMCLLPQLRPPHPEDHEGPKGRG